MFSRKLLLIVCCVGAFSFFSMADGPKVHIPIVYACDDKYVMPTIVSMESAMRSKKDTSFYEFTILVPSEFKDENKRRFDRFRNSYKDKCIVKIINMGSAFSDCYAAGWGKASLYRLHIPWIFEKAEKVIYIDGDTIVRHDLQEMWNIDLENNLCGGVIDPWYNRYEELTGFNKEIDKYINSGVLLINCKAWREEPNMKERIEDCIKKSNFRYPDQDTINVICARRIKVLSPKFNWSGGAFGIKDQHKKFMNFTENDFLEWKNNPVIVHFMGTEKPWDVGEGSQMEFCDEWNNLFNTIGWKYKIKELEENKSKCRCCCCKKNFRVERSWKK